MTKRDHHSKTRQRISTNLRVSVDEYRETKEMVPVSVMTAQEQEELYSRQDVIPCNHKSEQLDTALSRMTMNPSQSPNEKTFRRRSNSNIKKRSNSNKDHIKHDVQPPLPSRPPLHIPAWLKDITYVNDTTIPFATRLGHEILRYCEYTQQSIGCVQQTIEKAIWNLSICVQEIWPEATVTCFGSFSSGLWLPSSDVDVVVMGLPPSHSYGADELELLASKIEQVTWIHHIEVVKSAKVPVAKLILAENDLRVDISIENIHTRLGIQASVIVREYVGMIPLLHPLIIVLKQFLREKGLNDASTGGLSSYCLTLLAFYLLERQGAIQYTGIQVGQLLIDFVEFYGTIFQYTTTGISLKPEAFGEYRLNPHTTSFGMSPQLVIDDPVYLDGQHNAAAGAFAIARVITAWENAFYALRFHRPTKFTPTPLCQLLHWSGHGSLTKNTIV